MFNALDLRKVTDAVQEFSHFDDDVLDSWERIKKSLEGVQTQSGEAPNQQLKAAILLVRERAEELFLEEGQFDTLDMYLALLAKRAAV